MAGYRLYEGRRGAFYPAILALVSVVAILVVINVFSVNVKEIQDSTDVLGITLAAIAVFFFVIALGWSGYRTLKIDQTMQGVMMETAKTTSLVFIILLGAAMLTAAFRAFGGEELVRDFLTGLPGGFWTQFIIVMAVIFVLGFFLDFIEIAVVVVPIVAPILLSDPSANVTAVWLGDDRLEHPNLVPDPALRVRPVLPGGGVAPAIVRTVSMYKGVIPFIALQLLALVIVGGFPQLVNYLPTRLSLTAETSPPPKNPRLQLCLEDYVSERFAADGVALRARLEAAAAWDLDKLPKSLRGSVEGGLKQAMASFDKLAAAQAASAAVTAASDDYRSVQRPARRIELALKALDGETKDVKKEYDRLKRKLGDDDEVVALAAELEVLGTRRARLPRTCRPAGRRCQNPSANWSRTRKRPA